MALDVNSMKELLVSGILFFVLLIAIASFAPYAYDELTSAGTDNGTTIGDVPGGELFTGVVILLGMLVIGFAAVIKILDVI